MVVVVKAAAAAAEEEMELEAESRDGGGFLVSRRAGVLVEGVGVRVSSMSMSMSISRFDERRWVRHSRVAHTHTLLSLCADWQSLLTLARSLAFPYGAGNHRPVCVCCSAALGCWCCRAGGGPGWQQPVKGRRRPVDGDWPVARGRRTVDDGTQDTEQSAFALP